MRRSKHMYHLVKSPGKMSWQTTRTLKFKIKVQMPLTCPNTATCDPIPHAPNVLGVYNIEGLRTCSGQCGNGTLGGDLSSCGVGEACLFGGLLVVGVALLAVLQLVCVFRC